MKRNMFRKGIVLGILLLFVGASAIPSTGTIVERTTILDTKSDGYIQDLIDNASDSDTIYISSGIYYENILIDKSINLIGEDKNTTIIDGGYKWTVITIIIDQVNISGFTIRNSGLVWYDAGIKIKSNNTNVYGNNIIYNNYGIKLEFSDNNNISNNKIFSNNWNGIYLHFSSDNIIKENEISSNWNNGLVIFDYSNSNIIASNNITFNHHGISIQISKFNKIMDNLVQLNSGTGINVEGANQNNISGNIIDLNKNSGIIMGYFKTYWGHTYSHENSVKRNIIQKNNDGIHISGGGKNIIRYNEIKDNINGLLLYSDNNIISNNNFKKNNRDAQFGNNMKEKNIWNQNYWNKEHILPVIIFGKVVISRYLTIPWINFDWYPKKEPYNIYEE